MKARPILFSGPMVRALLDGTKTQTRRICKPAEAAGLSRVIGPFQCSEMGNGWFGDEEGDVQFLCPYGQPGDLLWVRETTRCHHLPNFLTGEPTEALCGQYVADDEPVVESLGFDLAWWYSKKLCPAIHMPRRASRLTLRITEVRVQRLQEISEEDAKAEGAPLGEATDGSRCHTLGFMDLWESINGPGSWDANPWVWCVSFEVIKQNVDAVLNQGEEHALDH